MMFACFLVSNIKVFPLFHTFFGIFFFFRNQCLLDASSPKLTLYPWFWTWIFRCWFSNIYPRIHILQIRDSNPSPRGLWCLESGTRTDLRHTLIWICMCWNLQKLPLYMIGPQLFFRCFCFKSDSIILNLLLQQQQKYFQQFIVHISLQKYEWLNHWCLRYIWNWANYSVNLISTKIRYFYWQ